MNRLIIIGIVTLSLTLTAAAFQKATAPKPAAAQDGIAVYFSPKGGCTDAIVDHISKATKTIKVQAYSFTSEPIAKALMHAHQRGVTVTAILDKSQRTEKYSSATFMHNQGIPVWIDAAHAIAPRPTPDGTVGTPDLLAVINAWGPCPVEGIVYTSNGTGGGDWFDPNSWNPPGVPGTERHFDVAIIRTGDAVTQSQQYPFTLGFYLLEDSAIHVFSNAAEIAALSVDCDEGQWIREGEIEPLIVVRNAAEAYNPRNTRMNRMYDCPTFCALLANPFYPYTTLQSCQDNPCGGSP